ncbi:hypothetical protein [Sphingobacterium mizutaii]|uniref:hypothetical protein n=1 Tax=Sphingobacterium mizutaii TaxID=1010 RepID=UPI0028ACDC5D|nr:hypothetical protein [Sphingobacterium mizutaii]
MKSQIKSYLEQVYVEVSSSISKQFDMRKNDLSKFCTFDLVNFHLISQYILDENKKDFFINIPQSEYRPNFFTSIFHSIVLIKLYQNYFSHEKVVPILDKGDLIYAKRNKEYRVFVVKNLLPEQIKINFRFPRKNEIGINDFPLKKQFLTKLNPNLVDTRNSTKNVNSYREFLSSNFNEDFPFITDFKNRTLVIAEKQFFNERKVLPIRYTSKKGKISNDLPFLSYLVECCNDFNSAKEFVLNSSQCFDEIIVIGDSKYRDIFDFILQEKYRGKYKNIVLIGTEKPDTENEFVEWSWSNDEVKIANNEKLNRLRKIALNDDSLYSLFIGLKSEVERIKEESKVNLAFILKYANFFSRMILVNTNLSKGIFREYLERLNHYFQSETFAEEVNSLFYGKDIYNPDVIEHYTNRILDKFSGISTYLETENLKWDYIKQKANSNQGKPFYLIVEKKNYDAINNQLLNESINTIRLISDKRIDHSKLYLDKWLNDEQNSQDKLVIIPYLNNMELYTKIKSVKGCCEVLCYENIDEISFDNVERSYQSQEKLKLTHNDRAKFIQTNFVQIVEFNKRDLDDVFTFDLNGENFKNNPYEYIDLPKEKAFYEVMFDDGTTEKFESSKGIFLIENGEQIKTTIGELYDNSTIRFYQNNSPKEFREILKIFDTENLLDSFDEYSMSWKQTLANLSSKFGGIENLYNRIFTTYRINYNTFRLYFDKNSQTRFPRVKTLEAIRIFCLNNGYTDELIVSEFEKFKVYSKRDHSIRQQAGKILGNDLLDYIASDKTEVSDSLGKLSQNILDKLTDTIQEKIVIRKTLLDE